MKYASILISILLAAVRLDAAEYFVNKHGSDANDGLAKDKAFITVQKGVDALKTGDTLTIGPGEYFETVKRDNLGGPAADTIIRAEIPGTVLLRGDVPAPEFKKVDGYSYVYAAGFNREPQAVNEVDTLTIMETAPSVVELEFTPGACFYDSAEKKIYISTSDMKAPDKHHYTVSVIKNYGLFLHLPERVTVEGIAATGYNSSDMQAGSPGDYTVSGIMLAGGKKCVIRRCAAFLNANGIFENSAHFTRYEISSNQIPVYGAIIPESTNGPGGNLVEKCLAYGNYSRHSGSGGNILIFNSTNDTIRDCVSHSSATHGMRHYGSIRGPAYMINLLSWGNVINDLHIKGGTRDGISHGFGYADRCVTLGPLHVVNVSRCIVGQENRYNSNMTPENIRYDLEGCSSRYLDFADPDNLDFRLQATSQFRGKSPDGSDRGAFQYETNIFYITPGGDDKADGLSAGNAWETLARGLKDLKAGDTLYLEGGEYQADLELKKTGNAGQGVSIRGRGIKPVIIKGALRIAESDGIAFERLNFADGISIVKSKNISFNNCRMAGREVNLKAEGVDGLRITHCIFTGFEKAALELESGKNAFLSGNIFDNAKCPALRLEGMEFVLYSDYNSYREAVAAWEVGGKAMSLAEVQKGQDKYSRMLSPEVKMAGGIPELGNQEQFTAGGPNGTALGIYREFKEREVKVSEPVAHSVTPTTANLEWWTSLPARCELGWGETPECTNTIQFNADGFCSFSLTGLKPGTKYYFKVASAKPLSNPGDYFDMKTAMAMPSAGGQPEAQPESILEFKTAKTRLDPVIYYVAPGGNDRSSGLSRDKAWRTVTHAAGKVNAGDTVMIAGGIYKETVRVRATGLQDRPITFKAIPGEKVIFDGDNKTLARAFMAGGKHHLRFDGLYFRLFSPGTRTSGIFCLYQCNDVQITRCFKDGRHGYSPSFVMAWGCSDMVIRNCAIISATYGNLYIVKCPGALVENNVLLRSLIMECVFVNEPEEKIRLAKNIITDNVPHKVMVALLEVACMASLVEEDNCYYFRIPPEKRKLVTFYDPVAYERTVAAYGLKPVDTSLLFTNLVQITMAEFQQKSGMTNSFAANPAFRATLSMKATDKDGKQLFMVDQLLGKKDLDFPDLFATDPEVVRRGIGLKPEDFADFKFNTTNRP
jgi:hypothetical protein